MKEINLETDRLTLRLVTKSDLENIHQLHSLPEINRFNTLGIPKDSKQTASVINQWILNHKYKTIRNYTFAVTLKPGKKFIGLIALNLGDEKYKVAEVWYKFHPDFWNKGYATESLKKILNFGFGNLKLHRIEAGCAVDNIASIKTLDKVGMTKEGRKRKVLPLQQGWSDNFEYAILSTDYKKQ